MNKLGYFVAVVVVIIVFTSTVQADPIRVVTEEFKPFQNEHLLTGKVVGPMSEVIDAVCKEAKTECEQIIIPWESAINGAEEGVYDCIFSIVDSPARREKFLMSDPIVKTGYSFFTLTKTRWNYSRPNSLNKLTVGVYGPSGSSRALAEVAAQATDVKIYIQATNIDTLHLLSDPSTKVTAVMMNYDVGVALINDFSLGHIRFAGDMRPVVYGFGCSRKSSRIHYFEGLSQALKRLQKNGKIKEILNRGHLLPAEPY